MWLGGSVMFADRRAEVLVWRCFFGALTHRIRLAQYQVRRWRLSMCVDPLFRRRRRVGARCMRVLGL